ncbi:MAG: cytochrome c biogenesis protein CcsA, partial [Deltaproteobacteria bacterium]|nr:cytochrome c biogenesis protein CcsA [Deltaproteobacteria bacterium]
MDFLLYTSFGLYFVAALLYFMSFLLSKGLLSKYAYRTMLLAWGLHSALLLWKFVRSGPPFLVDEASAYLFTAWAVGLALLLLSRWIKLSLVGALILPLIHAFYILSHFKQGNFIEQSSLLNTPWASVHLVFSFLAFALFAFSFVLGFLFLIEEFQLKYKVLPKVFLRFPSLDVLEQLHAKALFLGFLLLSLGILTGAFWAKEVTGFYFFEDPRQLGAI